MFGVIRYRKRRIIQLQQHKQCQKPTIPNAHTLPQTGKPLKFALKALHVKGPLIIRQMDIGKMKNELFVN